MQSFARLNQLAKVRAGKMALLTIVPAEYCKATGSDEPSPWVRASLPGGVPEHLPQARPSDHLILCRPQSHARAFSRVEATSRTWRQFLSAETFESHFFSACVSSQLNLRNFTYAILLPHRCCLIRDVEVAMDSSPFQGGRLYRVPNLDSQPATYWLFDQLRLLGRMCL